MTQTVDFSGRPFHFIGVGGIGMSALAQILAERHLPVSGSDLRLTHITERLQSLGVHIFWQQDAQNLHHFESAPSASHANSEILGFGQGSGQIIGLGERGGVATLTCTPTQCLPQVICSTAIYADNPEYRAAQELGCPIFHRSDILAALIAQQQSIAIAGTHGKTTTSGLIGYVLEQAGLDPTVVIGGEVAALGGNARSGQGSYLVAEADESDGSLVKFHPYIGVVTNMELDHPDHYQNLEQVIETFETFTSHCDVVVGCWDCENVRQHLPVTLSYSLERASGADYTVDQIVYGGDGTQARVWERGTLLGTLNVGLLGSHNLANALAAIAVGRHIGLSFEAIAQGIATYEGARRRFEYKGCAADICFVDDYAHHPSELLVTLRAAQLQVETGKTRLPVVPRRVVAIFQPHRYSRTQALLAEFATAFKDADEVVICEVYSAGERLSRGVNGEVLAQAIAKHHPNVHYCPSLEAVSAHLKQVLQPQDLALFLGAGNLNQSIPALLNYFEALEQPLERLSA